jgi:AraC-like DNA-binding protein
MAYEILEIPAKRDGWVKSFAPAGSLSAYHLHAHRELEINLVVRGRGIYFIKGGQYPIRAGMQLWLFPGQSHMLMEASDDFCMWVGVFRPRLIRRVVDDKGSRILLQKDPGEVFVHAINQSSFEFLTGFCTRLEAVEDGDAYFNSGLAFLLRSAWSSGTEANSMAPTAPVHEAVERAVHLMREGQLEGSLVDLAARAGISYSRLCGLFTEQVGQTPGDFRNNLRVQRFHYLMEAYPYRTLLDLALEAGFGSYAQCHRMVRRFTGHSPAFLRKASP